MTAGAVTAGALAGEALAGEALPRPVKSITRAVVVAVEALPRRQPPFGCALPKIIMQH
jgi:hypothetical protein